MEGVIVGINDIAGSYGTEGELEANPAFASAVLVAIRRFEFSVAPSLMAELENLRRP